MGLVSGAGLYGTNLTGADLSGAYLSGAELTETIFANVDLRGCRLENCSHFGPSIIDHRTLQRSGPLPLAFLRGVGLPEALIESLPSLLNQAAELYNCFISYSSNDKELVSRLYDDLQDKGVRCWFAPEDMKSGNKIRNRIDEAIRNHQKMLLVLSESSIASAWVEKEVETAFECEQEAGTEVLLPIRLDDTVMERKIGWAADIKRARHITDFTRWKEHDAYRKALERLLRDLRVEKA